MPHIAKKASTEAPFTLPTPFGAVASLRVTTSRSAGTLMIIASVSIVNSAAAVRRPLIRLTQGGVELTGTRQEIELPAATGKGNVTTFTAIMDVAAGQFFDVELQRDTDATQTIVAGQGFIMAVAIPEIDALSPQLS